MAKQTGLGDDLYVGGYHIGGDIQDVTVHGGPALLDVTDITQSAHARLGGLRDGAAEFTAFFDPAAGAAHAALSPLPTADVIVTYLRGQATGNPAACINAKQVNYDPTRANDGMLTEKISCQANGFGLEWCLQLTPGLRTDTAATQGPSISNPAGATNFGAQGYLQVVSFTGTDVTVKIQHSTTSGSGYTDLIPFTQITGSTPLAQRAVVSNSTTVDQFLRITTSTVGGFTSVAFQVSFCRNLTAGQVF